MASYLVLKRMNEDRMYLPGEVLHDPKIDVGILMERGFLQIVPDNFKGMPTADQGQYRPTGPVKKEPVKPEVSRRGPAMSIGGAPAVMEAPKPSPKTEAPVSDGAASEPESQATTTEAPTGDLPPVIDLSGVQAETPATEETKPPEA